MELIKSFLESQPLIAGIIAFVISITFYKIVNVFLKHGVQIKGFSFKGTNQKDQLIKKNIPVDIFVSDKLRDDIKFEYKHLCGKIKSSLYKRVEDAIYEINNRNIGNSCPLSSDLVFLKILYKLSMWVDDNNLVEKCYRKNQKENKDFIKKEIISVIELYNLKALSIKDICNTKSQLNIKNEELNNFIDTYLDLFYKDFIKYVKRYIKVCISLNEEAKSNFTLDIYKEKMCNKKIKFLKESLIYIDEE